MYILLFAYVVNTKKVSLCSPFLQLRELDIGQNIGEVVPSKDLKNEFILNITDQNLAQNLKISNLRVHHDILGYQIYNYSGCLTANNSGLNIEQCVDIQSSKIIFQRFKFVDSSENEQKSKKREPEEDFEKLSEAPSAGKVSNPRPPVLFSKAENNYNFLNEDDEQPFYPKIKKKKQKINNLVRAEEAPEKLDEDELLHLNGKNTEIEDQLNNFLSKN